MSLKIGENCGPAMLHVLLVEPQHGGHRLNLAGLLLDALARLPVRVTLDTSPDAPASPQFQQWIAPRLANATVRTSLPMPDWREPRGTIGRLVTSLDRSIAETKPDHVLVPGGDGVVQMATLQRLTRSFRKRPGVEMEAMLLRGKFAYRRGRPTLRDRLDELTWFAGVAGTPFDRVHHMDPLVYDAAIARAPTLSRKLARVPDPVDPIDADWTIEQARRSLDLPTDGRLFGCVGGLQTRKGIDLLIRSFVRLRDANRLRENDRLLLVGPPNAEIAALLDGEARPPINAGKLILIGRFVDDVTMSHAISAMNLVVTAYPGHVGSASIALRAAAQRRPVLADRFGWCGRIVPQFELGQVIDVTDASAFDDAIVRALDASETHVPSPRAEQLVRYSSGVNFQRHWMRRLRERLDLEPEPLIESAEPSE